MKKIFINASSCGVGGAVQVAIGFILCALKEAPVRGWRLSLAVSVPVGEFVRSAVEEADVKMQVFDVGPGSLIGGHKTRAALRRLVIATESECVFTIFGPSYVGFNVPEFMGFADGFAITPERGCYLNHGLQARLSAWFKANLKRIALHSACRFWVETDAARRGMVRRAWVGAESVTVIPNGVNALFAEALAGEAPAESGDILLLGAGYPHKNLQIVPQVALAMAARKLPYPWRFVVTLPSDSAAWLELDLAMQRAGLASRCVNLGVLNLAECARAIERATLVFHPSLLEIFSATYVESMAARRPLIVSDRDFAREICGDAAVYFDPLDPGSAASAIISLMENPAARAALIDAGTQRLHDFPDAASKNRRLCDWLESCLRSFSKQP